MDLTRSPAGGALPRSGSGAPTPRACVAASRRVLRTVLAALATLTPLLGLGACGGDERERVAVLITADEAAARPVLAAFERATGIRVDATFVPEATDTATLLGLLRSPGDRPRADVLWSADLLQTIRLAESGAAAPLRSAAADAWPPALRDPEGRWFAFAARAGVIAYAPERVAEHEVPTAWTDLVRDWWRGRIAMPDPRAGMTAGQLGAMKAYWDREFMPGYYGAFLEGLRENEIRVLPTGSAVIEAIASGEADAGMTDSAALRAAQARGVAIAGVAARHDPDEATGGGGAFLLPSAVALLAGSSSPALAARFIDFMLSPEVELLLLEASAPRIPLRPDRLPASAATLLDGVAVADPLRARASAVLEQMESASAAATRLLGSERTPPPSPDR
ncbi:MAG TPA: extracellular solute-binding protein [Phycisphaerales bacterium]|nr:extracellular solute-binding protein [Phycisphaerales bacterium]HMP36779.1 extracellular solute-binding protein [Phycisphaerales bacterium]